MPIFLHTKARIAAAAASGGAVVGAVAWAVLLRGRRGRDSTGDVARRLGEAESRLDELRRDVERARGEARRLRGLVGVVSTVELDALLARVLESAAALPGVDATLIAVPGDATAPVVATLGMSAEEAARHPLGERTTEAAGAPGIAFAYAPERPDAGPDPIRGGVVLALPGDPEEASGMLAAFWRHEAREPSEADVAALEELASTAGPALANARRFQEARKLADLDALTGLHNRRFFHDILAREVARAHRYGRKLALVVFDIDDFKAINERVGHLAGDAVLAELGERVRAVVRSADVACRVGGDEFAVVLPESGLSDAEQLYGRLEHAVATRATGVAERLQLSAGIAELRPGDDAASFFERADEALFKAKDEGKGRYST